MKTMIDRYLIRYFLAVVEQGNFSRAAVHCNVSQPTLSVAIAKLEKSLEHKLFVRSNQRVELTRAGARFLPHARRIEREFNSALRALSTTRQHDALRLGILHTIPGNLIARAAQAGRAMQPGPVEFIFAGERDLLGRMTRGRVDAIFTVMRPAIREFTAEPITEEGYAVVLASDHPLAARSVVRAEELADEAMIVRRHCELLSQTSRHFLDRGVRPHFSLRTTNDERALQMVSAGMGVTVMPSSYRASGVRQVMLADFDYRRTLGLYTADGRHAAHPLVLAIIDALRTTNAGDGFPSACTPAGAT